MTKRQTLWVIIALVLILVVVGLLIAGMRQQSTDTDTVPNQNGQGATPTRSDVSPDTRVPEAGETPAEDVAVPQTVTDAAPGVDARFRGFTVTVANNTFDPSTIIVREGDTTNIRFTAQDKDYDFTQPDYGLSAKLLKGKEQVIEFAGVTPGRFTFYCQSCGGPSAGPVGTIVVVPKD